MDHSRSAPMGARLDAMIAAAEADTLGLKREMGPLSLAALGIATIIGAGIFVLSGDAASQFAGPGVVLSFAIAGIAAAFSALCYAELVSMIPVSGSTYVFAYASLGNFLAWVIGWDLLLEYLLGGSAIAAGWAGYFGNVLGHIGITLPDAITGGPFGGGGVINLPAVFVVVLVTSVLLAGARESARATSWLVALKLAVLVLFVVVGAFYISSANLHPFVPHNTGHFGAYGWSGVVRAAAVVFFAYIGFDVVCTATQEARNPRRTVPIGLLGALAVATVLYIAVGFVMTGLINYRQLASPDALSIALGAHPGLAWLQSTVDVGAMIALAASVLATIYAQTRIFMRMAQDGMLPAVFGRIDRGSGTPRVTTIVCGAGAALISGLVPLSTLGDLVSAGTMLAFIIVSVAVLVLRRTRSDLPRPFRLPLGPTIPLLAAIVSLGVLLTLPVETLLRVVIWLVIGLGVYFGYGRTRAREVDAARTSQVIG
jgi:basic amino acid/polyamine antiporter, APA family